MDDIYLVLMAKWQSHRPLVCRCRPEKNRGDPLATGPVYTFNLDWKMFFFKYLHTYISSRGTGGSGKAVYQQYQ